MIAMPVNRNNPNPDLVHWQRQKQIILYAALLVNIILATTANILQNLYICEPYHTSALSGEAWVLELLCGQPDQIHTELGVTLEVFNELIQELQRLGYDRSQYVSLEEQLAIFLYECN